MLYDTVGTATGKHKGWLRGKVLGFRQAYDLEVVAIDYLTM
jgi:hypothetical protein